MLFRSAFRLRPDPEVRSAHRPALSLPDKPSIAVLPFENLSDDLEQEYFADGMVEEIITALSRMRWLFVIARNSSFTYKGRAVDVKQVGRDLGVRYVLEGSVRKAGKKVRITGQLIDASTGAHLWAEHFDGTLDDIFDLQEQVTANVTGAVAPKLEQAEIERAKRKPTDNLDAYDYFLRGLSAFRQHTQQGNSEALSLLYKAIELDPNFAVAYGTAARCYTQRKMSNWVSDQAFENAETARLVRQVAEVGRDDAEALLGAGFAVAFVLGDLDDGDALINRAIALNPNLAEAWFASGWVKVWRGETDAAIEREAHAMRLSPHDVFMFSMLGATAAGYFFAGRYDQALSWAEKAIQTRQSFIAPNIVAAASAALSGNEMAAEKALTRLRLLLPEIRLSDLHEFIPTRLPDHSNRLVDGMRKAGLLD